jgi:hypothetical protein
MPECGAWRYGGVNSTYQCALHRKNSFTLALPQNLFKKIASNYQSSQCIKHAFLFTDEAE